MRRLEQLGSLAADVARLEHEVFGQFVLHADVPLLDIGRAQVAINRAKLKSLGNVSQGGQPRCRIDRVGRAVCSQSYFVPSRT